MSFMQHGGQKHPQPPVRALELIERWASVQHGNEASGAPVTHRGLNRWHGLFGVSDRRITYKKRGKGHF
ncbi:hypothetical protein CHELA40_13840 [Chelatococcus asaccharovorans]|nr:hypothetical protein CHELA40_13840 [Chelatococcus asaccharovorans]